MTNSTVKRKTKLTSSDYIIFLILNWIFKKRISHTRESLTSIQLILRGSFYCINYQYTGHIHGKCERLTEYVSEHRIPGVVRVLSFHNLHIRDRRNLMVSWTMIDWLINWLIVYCFTSRSKIIYLYKDAS